MEVRRARIFLVTKFWSYRVTLKTKSGVDFFGPSSIRPLLEVDVNDFLDGVYAKIAQGTNVVCVDNCGNFLL